MLTPSRSMSSRRQAVLVAIRQHFRETGCSPSYVEIGERTGLEPRHVRPHLDQLQTDGLITYRRRGRRSIALVDRSASLSDEEVEFAVHARGWQLIRSALPALVQAVPLDPRMPAAATDLLHRIDDLTKTS